MEKRAETYALMARNAKARWTDAWCGLASDKQRAQALRSPYLEESLRLYSAAFNEDLNHFYSGLNALGLLSVLVELASALPEVWTERFDQDLDAARELDIKREALKKLAYAVELSLCAAKLRLQREQRVDPWVELSEADLCLLISKRPARVAQQYREGLAQARGFNVESVREQLRNSRALGICSANVQAALAEFPASAVAATFKRVLLFTGHMIDAPGRTTPRFPPDKEALARAHIQQVIAQELAPHEGVAFGIAGGASGGDILFHELCAEAKVETKLYLALPRDPFVANSVAPAGPAWIDRFNRLALTLRRRVLQESAALPRWLRDKPGYNVWQRNNLWMLHNALAHGADKVTLIALWNKQSGDGPGGTGDLVAQARARGAKTIIIDSKEIFGL